MIAVWNYIDENRVTQPGATNLLEAGAMRHDIFTPPAPDLPRVPSDQGTDWGGQDDATSQGGRSEVVTSNLLLGPGSETLTYTYSPSMFVHNQAYHIQTQLPDGRKSLLIDPGSVGNLCGDKWAKEMAQEAARNGRKPSYTKRQRPLKVSGVGNGSQSCQYDCLLPVAFRQDEEQDPREGHISIPTVSGSELPGLLGLTALRKNRAILDLHTMKMYFAGPGEYNLLSALPPGTDCFQAEIAPSGHMVIPCCEFGRREPTQHEHSLTLMSRTPRAPPGLEQREDTRRTPGSSSKRARVIPPPPNTPAPVVATAEVVPPPPSS